MTDIQPLSASKIVPMPFFRSSHTITGVAALQTLNSNKEGSRSRKDRQAGFQSVLPGQSHPTNGKQTPREEPAATNFAPLIFRPTGTKQLSVRIYGLSSLSDDNIHSTFHFPLNRNQLKSAVPFTPVFAGGKIEQGKPVSPSKVIPTPSSAHRPQEKSRLHPGCNKNGP